MARDVGYLSPHYTVPCNETNDGVEDGERICKVQILGIWLDTASFRYVDISTHAELRDNIACTSSR